MGSTGRVVESAGIRLNKSLEARTVGATTPGADRVAAYEAKTPCPRSQGLAPRFDPCLHVLILMNSLIVKAPDAAVD